MPFFLAAAEKVAGVSRSEPASCGMSEIERTLARSQRLEKRERIASRRDFLSIYEKGIKVFGRFVVAFSVPNELTYSRLGITATKKLGKANRRNLAKRWIREVYRVEKEKVGLTTVSADVVVNVKPNAATASFEEFRADLLRCLTRTASSHRTGQV